MVEKTFVNKGKPETQWLLIDANGQKLGRMATKIAHLLMGKHKPNYAPGVTMGDSVIVINASGVKVNTTREKEKVYYRHSNYPGGLKEVTYPHMLEDHPERIIEFAVKGMLPHNRYGRALLKRLKVYAGSTHPHQGQNPEKMD
ncbi:MAG: 50S ribosomal protein L13 [Chloroflexi bacterium]|nr:50S ribosomal protein L13 [Chloroflexota bacterium]